LHRLNTDPAKDVEVLGRDQFADVPVNDIDFPVVATQPGSDRALVILIGDGVAYPAVLLTTGTNDPRVEAWIPAKMAARLQAATRSDKPVLLRVEFDAGHGIGSTRQQFDAQIADMLAFALAESH
jgi:prolyl oligopeptidase